MKKMMSRFQKYLSLFLLIGFILVTKSSQAEDDRTLAFRRASYLLRGRMPSPEEHAQVGRSKVEYDAAVRKILISDEFYEGALRYHERLLGVGLPEMYLEELQSGDRNDLSNPFARIQCRKEDGRFKCGFLSRKNNEKSQSECDPGQERPIRVFWHHDVNAWVCPQVVRTCAADLSRCFIEHGDENEARNAELGASAIFDSRFNIIKSLSRQPAGIGAAVAVENFPYTHIFEPGLTAVDGAIAHLYRQGNHFALEKLHLPSILTDKVSKMPLSDSKFRLVYSESDYSSAGILSTFGWLRRYEKNRTRANQVYERLMCRRLTAELPTFFPQDPGDLRTREGCKGCHATLDPMADFFNAWGEGGDLYKGPGNGINASFAGKNGVNMHDFAKILQDDPAFATCTVQNVWEWLMGRKFNKSEEALRSSLSHYFINTKYSFRELVYAVATHQAFTASNRTDAVVSDPLEQPPLGKVPDVSTAKAPCPDTVNYTTDIAPLLAKADVKCDGCHKTGTNRMPLESEANWKSGGKVALGLMSSGTMPPGMSGPPVAGNVFQLKEAVRCWLEKNP